jgi:heptosyltransferase-2/heptosyltransferase-3
VDKWAVVANELAQRHRATIILTGGPGETALAQAIAGKLSAPHIILAGETSLGQLAAVFAHCRLTLGADSGPLHLAVAVGVPTVHVFGPVDPVLFGPWGDPAQHIVVQARFFDTPCHNRPCNHLDYSASELPLHLCMQTITADDVLAAAEKILSAVPPTAHGTAQ